MDLLALWIFIFSTPGTLDPGTQRLAQTRPRGQNLRFPRFDPMILCSFLATIRWTTLENHSSKQMMVYDQITFFLIWVFRFFRAITTWKNLEQNREKTVKTVETKRSSMVKPVRNAIRPVTTCHKRPRSYHNLSQTQLDLPKPDANAQEPVTNALEAVTNLLQTL